MRLRKWIISLLALALVSAGALVGYRAQAQDSGDEATVVMFIGHVTDNPDEFVGVAIRGDDATLYICDGQPEAGTVSILEWFIGKVEDNALDVTAPSGNRVAVAFSADSAVGHFAFGDGSVRAFELEPAGEGAGLYRADFSLHNVAFVAGWLVLEDGSVRGGVINTATGELVPATLQNFAVAPLAVIEAN